MHSDEMEDVDEVAAGEICALFGVECTSGDTFCGGKNEFLMETMFVPEPVMSLAIKPKKTQDLDGFGKALTRFVQQVRLSTLLSLLYIYIYPSYPSRPLC